MRVLIVEDDPGVLEAVIDAISARRDEYDHAAGLDRARELFETRNYGYVLLDLQIPSRDNGAFPMIQYGLKMLECIRNTPGKQDTPVIAMTSHHSDAFELSPELNRLGVSSCVSKPFDQRQPLVAVIDKALAAHVERPTERKTPRRGERAVNIERLRDEMIQHLRDAFDHARQAQDRTGTAELLPRPTKKELAGRLKMSPSSVTRCFQDPGARELCFLWENSIDVDWILQEGRQRKR